jgi:hypothetical protein
MSDAQIAKPGRHGRDPYYAIQSKHTAQIGIRDELQRENRACQYPSNLETPDETD